MRALVVIYHCQLSLAGLTIKKLNIHYHIHIYLLSPRVRLLSRLQRDGYTEFKVTDIIRHARRAHQHSSQEKLLVKHVISTYINCIITAIASHSTLLTRHIVLVNIFVKAHRNH